MLYTRDARGNVSQVRRKAKPGSGEADIVASADFDTTCSQSAKCNRPNFTVDPKGNRTDYTYAAATGLLSRVDLPAPTTGGVRPAIEYAYTPLYARVLNASGVLVDASEPQAKLIRVTRCATASTCPGSANEQVVAYAYANPNLLVTSVTVAAGDGSTSATTSYAYDARDNLVDVDGPLAGSDDTTTYFYDSQDRLIGAIGPDPDGGAPQGRAAHRLTYDTGNRVTKIERGTASAATLAALNAMTVLETFDIAYDADGQPVRRTVSGTAGAWQVTQFSYDADKRLECVAERMNPAALASLPASACSLGPAGTGANEFGPDRITKTTYDAAGQLMKVQTGVRSTEVIDAITRGYSLNGQIAFAVDGENNRTSYDYDGHDRLRQVRYPVAARGANASSATDYEQFAYDPSSNITSRRLRDGATIGLAYDGLDRPVLQDMPPGQSDISHAYDLLGRLTSESAGGETLLFGFDALGRNTSQASPLGTVAYAYDAASHRTRITWPAAAGAASLSVDYDYDVAGKPTAIRENGAASGAGLLASYAYDAFGRPSTVTFGNGTVQSVSFNAQQLLAAHAGDLAGASYDVSTSLAYNPAGQIVSRLLSNDAYAFQGRYNLDRSYTANGLNQLTNAGGTALGYDARGNLTSLGNETFGYDARNLLVSAPGATLAYDALGRLGSVTRNAATSRFLYDGLSAIGEHDAAGNVLARFVQAPGIDRPIVWYDGAGLANKRYLMVDERGSVTSVTDASGAVLAINRYDEFGIPAPGNLGRFQYTGQMWLGEIGLYHYKARMYSPSLGRFMQTDPLGYADGMNLYAYIGNDPINFTDPLGLEASVSGQTVGTGNSLDGQESGVQIVVTGEPCDMIYKSVMGPNNPLSLGTAIVVTGFVGQRPPQKENQCPTPPATRPIGRVGKWEAGLRVGLKHPSALGIIAGAFEGAKTAAKRLFPGMSIYDDGPADAMKHFIGAFTLTRSLGAPEGKLLLDANEVSNSRSSKSTAIDTYNNWVAMYLADNTRMGLGDAIKFVTLHNCLITAY